MHGIRESHKPLKTEIKNHFKKISFKMTEETKQEEFLHRLTDLPIFHNKKMVIK